MASGKDITTAAAIIIPLVSAFIESAEGTEADSKSKHAAVAMASESAYRALQDSGAVKEVKDVPWELIAPLVIPVGAGIISIIVGFFNKIGRFLTKQKDVQK